MPSFFEIDNKSHVNLTHTFNIVKIEGSEYIVDFSYFKHLDKEGLARYESIKRFVNDYQEGLTDQIRRYLRDPHCFPSKNLLEIEEMIKVRLDFEKEKMLKFEMIIAQRERATQLNSAIEFIRKNGSDEMKKYLQTYNYECFLNGTLTSNLSRDMTEFTQTMIKYYEENKSKPNILLKVPNLQNTSQEEILHSNKLSEIDCDFSSQEQSLNSNKLPEISCDFDSIKTYICNKYNDDGPLLKKQKIKFPFSVDQIKDAIMASNHNVTEWVSMCSKAERDMQEPIIQAIALIIIDAFPKQIERTCIHLPMKKAVQQGKRISYKYTKGDGSQIGVIQVLKPSKFKGVKEIYMSLNDVRVDSSKIAGGIFYLNDKLMPEPFTEKRELPSNKRQKVSCETETRFSSLQQDIINDTLNVNGLPSLFINDSSN